jgi:hypothetical protein
MAKSRCPASGRFTDKWPSSGAWVELENGENWFFHFQDKGVYGRIVHLQPLSWRADGWPQIGQRLDDHGKGQPVSLHRLPALPLAPCCLQTSDDFPCGQPGLQWQWQANPQRRWLMPHAQGLRLRCAPTASDISLYRLPQLLLQNFPLNVFTCRQRFIRCFLRMAMKRESRFTANALPHCA